MMNYRLFLRHVLAVGGALILSFRAHAASYKSADGLEHFPPVKLRAYGTISADRKVLPGNPQSSVLLITCESEPRAQLLLAKYLSDLKLLPGVTPLEVGSSRGTIAAHQVEGQGVVAAARCGPQVFIFTAADVTALKSLYETNISPTATINAVEAEIPVPMYLDRWDKHGFRFYYGPFTKPEDANHHPVPDYDPRQDFTFAKQSGDVGLVIWNSPASGDSSEGIMDLNSREWVYRLAKQLDLPLGINLGLEAGNHPLMSRYPNGMVPNADGYLGGWYGSLNFGIGKTVAWSSAATQDVALGQLQPLMRALMPKYDNIVNWLEPHEEMCHGVCDLLDDHGPDARANFHDFLKSKYGTVEALAKHWSQPGAFKTWDDVPFPELATFLGWNANAIDLTGMWKFSFDAPYGIDSAKTDLDDSAWGSIQAPGHAIAQALPRKPAIFRRHIQIDPAWRAKHPKVWILVWDLNDTRSGEHDPKGNVLVYVNGQAMPENPPRHVGEHWCALEVTSALVDGDNQITLGLPQAIIDYRCYLSGEAPGVYPSLGPKLNAQWADFSDWTAWSRGQAVRRGAQMIRQIDPDRPITLMSPDVYLSPIKAVAEDYGGIVHDTGGMAGAWTDREPVFMQSSGVPTDCEPGSGAVDLDDFKRFMGRWSTEGTQGVDYFQHIGDVEWKPEVEDYFGKTLNLWHLIGKYHLPQADLAILDSDRNGRLVGFPWDTYDHTDVLFPRNDYWALVSYLMPTYLRSGIVEDDFARGNADQYRVVLDSNSTILDPEVVEQIAKWVRKGGIFITYQQTGRHTSVQQDAWPISKLTGYAVTGIDKLAPNGDGRPSRHLHPVAGQTVFHTDAPGWNYVENSAGESLKKVDPACQDLLQWDDGSIAVGLRKLGKGTVIHLGSNSSALVPQVLEWAKVRHVAGGTGNPDIVTRHFISNNGLYDVWVLWNSKNEPVTTTLTFSDGFKPVGCRDVNTGEAIPVDTDANGAKLSNLALEPWQTRAFLVPRGQIANAPAEWFNLQCGWWKGTAGTGKPIPPYKARLAVNLTDDWAFKPMADTLPVDGTVIGTPPEDLAQVDPKLDDSAWPRMPLGIFDIPDHPDINHAFFRKRFTVPKEWSHGKVRLFTDTELLNRGRKYMDGQPIKAEFANDTLGGILIPGSTHLLALEIWGVHKPLGAASPVWISYLPDPLSRQMLNAGWSFAKDFATYVPLTALPATITGKGSSRTVAKIDARQSTHNVVVHVRTNNCHAGALIFNGHLISATGNIYRDVDFNVTPWVKFGQDNEIILLCEDTLFQEASIDFYDKKDFP